MNLFSSVKYFLPIYRPYGLKKYSVYLYPVGMLYR